MTKGITLFLMSSAIAVSLLFAQEPGSHRTPPAPADIAQHRVNRLTRFLDLTAAQQQEALVIFTTAATSASKVFPQMKTARTQLRADIENNNTSALSLDTTNIANLQSQIILADAQAQAALRKVLTPDQQTKLSQARGRGRGRFGFGRGPGGPEGFRGRLPR